MVDDGRDPGNVVEEKGLKQISDTGAIAEAIDQVMAGNVSKVEEFRSGKDKLLGWFVGQVMKQTRGKANPSVVNEILRKKLSGI